MAAQVFPLCYHIQYAGSRGNEGTVGIGEILDKNTIRLDNSGRYIVYVIRTTYVNKGGKSSERLFYVTEMFPTICLEKNSEFVKTEWFVAVSASEIQTAVDYIRSMNPFFSTLK